MSHSLTATPRRRMPLHAPALLAAVLLISTFIYFYAHRQVGATLQLATATTGSGLSFSYEILNSEMTVDWSGGGDFDPRGKCPDDFFGAGFHLVCKKLADGTNVKFLYHKGKQLLYRIDKDVIREKVMIGLHWVSGTQFNARYRVADDTYKGGKTVEIPNAKGGVDQAVVEYGEAVSKKRARPGRELFRETHIEAGECSSWWDIFDFMP